MLWRGIALHVDTRSGFCFQSWHRTAARPAPLTHSNPFPRPPIHPRSLLVQQWPLVLTLLAGLLATKIAIISALGPLFGLSRAESVRTGFILSQVCRQRGGVLLRFEVGAAACAARATGELI